MSEPIGRDRLLLGNLMSIIFRDGGHMQSEIGTESAVTQPTCRDLDCCQACLDMQAMAREGVEGIE